MQLNSGKCNKLFFIRFCNLFSTKKCLNCLKKYDNINPCDVDKAMEPMYTSVTDGSRSGMGFSFMEAFMDGLE